MSKQHHNRVTVVFNAQHRPYLYGAIHIVRGSQKNQWWERPFVISKKTADGKEEVYGTVKRTLQRIELQLERLKRFLRESEAVLNTEGIKPVDREQGVLPESDVTDRILDEQESVIEDVLLNVSVYIRILSELFPTELRKRQVRVYDYDGKSVGRIELSEIANLLLHNRYVLVKGHYVVDLFSDRKFMAGKPQTGLKISFPEYMTEVGAAVDGITVRDLVKKLRQMTGKLSASSNIRDVVFLTQNLYTLGGFVVGTNDRIESGPVKTILDRVTREHIEKSYPRRLGSTGTERFDVAVAFGMPRFFLEPNLDRKQVRIEMKVNGKNETLVMDCEEFFRAVLEAAGSTRLNANTV